MLFFVLNASSMGIMSFKSWLQILSVKAGSNIP